MLIKTSFDEINFILNKDTDGWTSKYRDCAGEFQSPINIDPGSAIREFYPRMIFGNYNLLAAENITNNGHTGI